MEEGFRQDTETLAHVGSLEISEAQPESREPGFAKSLAHPSHRSSDLEPSQALLSAEKKLFKPKDRFRTKKHMKIP